MKLYTRTGDDGTTGLFGGDRVSKNHPRVEAYGTVDELNAAVGFATAAYASAPAHGCENLDRMLAILTHLQSRLFDIGADLATPEDSRHKDKSVAISDLAVTEIEGWIDEVDEVNAEMTAFVLPGGSELAARLHLARTICRRAERCVIQLSSSGNDINPLTIVYLNRLSDLLFAMSRRANAELGIEDVKWEKGST